MAIFSNHTNHSIRVSNLDGCKILNVNANPSKALILYSFLVPVSRAH